MGLRTYGRVPVDPNVPNGPKRWVVVETDPATGDNTSVWLTTLVQCLFLNLGESPFFANYGIPAKPSVVQQIFPDFDVAKTQRQFQPHFASLIVAKENNPTPTYNITVTTNQGARRVERVAK